jgi:hypothetical protein
MAAPLVLAGKAAMDFSSGMVDIAQKANLTQAQTDAMAQGILRAANAAHQMPEAMRAGVDALSGFGIDPRDAMAMIGPIGQLGTAMKVDIADGAASANLQNLKVGLGDTGKALDIMAAGGNVGLRGQGHGPLLPQPHRTGPGAGPVRPWRRGRSDRRPRNRPARRGHQRGSGHQHHQPAGQDQLAHGHAPLPRTSASTSRRAQGRLCQGKTPMEALAEITKKATGGDLSKLGLVVEDMQAQSALRTLILNMDDYRKIRTDLGKSGGTVEAAFHQREAHDASVAWEGFKGSVSALAITLGATLLPASARSSRR